MTPSLLLAFYGDDFTGSTDVLESLSLAGIRARLFLKPPTPGELAGLPEGSAVGVAGNSRAMAPAEMDEVLPAVFQALEKLEAPLFHYKVCSTFDSSPETGSIGHAIDLAQKIFRSPFVPILVGAPPLARYCAFGNLFARSGLDSEVFRLDRHPTMRCHPITPMDESDLRVHLSRQTQKCIALFDVLALESGDARLRFQHLLQSNPELVLFDVLNESHLTTLGNLLWTQATDRPPLFAVGSSGVEYALTAYWRSEGMLKSAPAFTASEAAQLVCVSGSCSPVTDRQIAWALEHGFQEVAVDTKRLVVGGQAEEEVKSAVTMALNKLCHSKGVIIHTCRGPEDPRIGEVAEALHHWGQTPKKPKRLAGQLIGRTLGRMLSDLVPRTEVRRVVVMGGDTSYEVASQMNVRALEMVAPIASGSPLCRILSEDQSIADLEILFKGGQVGTTSLIDNIQKGISLRPAVEPIRT